MTIDPLPEDTITAISTPVGQAGIGIIRISGPRSGEIAEKIFKPKRPVQELESHQLYLGHLIDPSTGSMIDEVLLSFMKAPHSYTTEDVVEINSHSGYFILSKILRIIQQEGVRLAKPGEFTFRAFMKGRIDLTQAEAIIDLINSKSEKGLELATRQVRGRLGDQIEELQQKVLEILAHLEVAIDFPEEEPEILSKKETGIRLEKEIIEPLHNLIRAHSQRKIWMDGIHTVIVGRVNVGKSSLLNRLLNEERAIVTSIPGTTRDIIESTIHIKGIPLKLMDTAGFRRVKGEVERVGLRLTEQKFAEADLLLIVIDQSCPLNRDDRKILSRSPKDKSIIILNKIDLPSGLDKGELAETLYGYPVIRISALTGEGIENLHIAIRERIMGGKMEMTATHVVPNLRHKQALEEAAQFLKTAAINIENDLPTEIIAMDIHSGLDSLGEIRGETTPEQILDKIFSRFCIGK